MLLVITYYVPLAILFVVGLTCFELGMHAREIKMGQESGNPLYISFEFYSSVRWISHKIIQYTTYAGLTALYYTEHNC